MDIATAQVTPKEFVDKLLASALKTQLVEVMIDTVVGVLMNDNDDFTDGSSSSSSIVGVKTMNHGVIETDSMLICLGPWSGKICFGP
jgi:glycine/D-amino acid oxidase-like deaminating enzyme